MTNVDDVVKNFLEHYGVKGMRWGVRTDRSGSSSAARKAARKAPQPVVVTTTRTGRLKTKGGANQPAVPEAKLTAKARQQARRSGTKSLTNEQLQAAVARMQLEQNFKRLDEQPGAVGKFISDLLKSQGKQQANSLANDIDVKRVGEALRKKK